MELENCLWLNTFINIAYHLYRYQWGIQSLSCNYLWLCCWAYLSMLTWIFTGSYQLKFADDFAYTDPVCKCRLYILNNFLENAFLYIQNTLSYGVFCCFQVDGSTVHKQGVRFVFADGSRIIFRLSVSIYLHVHFNVIEVWKGKHIDS